MVFHEGLTTEQEPEEVTEFAGFKLGQQVVINGNYRLDLKAGKTATVDGFDPGAGLIHVNLFNAEHDWSKGHLVQPEQISPIRNPHKND